MTKLQQRREQKTKTCARCKEDKLKSEFRIKQLTQTGTPIYSSRCINCLNEVSRLKKLQQNPNDEIDYIEGEIWKDIPGYEGLHKCSTHGRIYTYEKHITTYEKRRQVVKREKGVLRSTATNTHDYESLTLYNDGIKKRFYVHRLVAMTFLPTVEGKPYVNHIDGNKKNNRLDNLEWCDNGENMIHSLSNGLSSQKGETHKFAREVIDTFTGKVYGSIDIAAKEVGLSYSALKAMLSGQNHNRTTLKYQEN